MEIQLLLISKLCSEIISTKTIKLSPNILRTLEDIYQTIYEFSHVTEENYQIFWRYSTTKFVSIDDYFSYIASLNAMAENKIYLLLKDYEEPWRDNDRYLRVLDQVEMRQEMERNRDIYDVKIKRKDDPDSDEEDERMLREAEDFVPDQCRSDSEVLAYALRKMPERSYYTDDLTQKFNLIRDVQQGIAKDRRVLVRPKDEVIERSGKRKGDKKKKKGDKKGKKKDKKGKKAKGKGAKKGKKK